MTDGILAWHFCSDTLRDGSPIPADGVTLRHDGDLIMCETGLHASVNIMDALKYAPGHTICRVRVEGHEEQGHDDKLVCRSRTILWRIDGEQILRDFARWCALQVVHLWDAPAVAKKYLETGKKELRDAAWAAAGAAAGAAAQAAARDAARDAARGAAAQAAAWDAARAAARDAQNKQLTVMVMESAGKTDD